MSITYCVCVCVCVCAALVILHAKRMRRAILLSMVCPALLYFSTLLHKQHDFRKEVIEYKGRVMIFSTTLSETFLTLRRIQQDIIINVYRSSCKVFLFSWQILIILDSSPQISEKSFNIKFRRNISCVSRFISCRRTDVTKLIVAFSNFSNAPKRNTSSACKNSWYRGPLVKIRSP